MTLTLIPVGLDIVAMIVGHRLVEFKLPIWSQVLIVLAAIGLVRHRWLEWKRAGEHSKFTTAMRFVFREVAALQFSDLGSDQDRIKRLDEYFTNVLSAFCTVFQDRLDAKLNVMPLTNDGMLRIQFVYPPGTTYDPRAIFEPGEGAAGIAFESGCLVYVPAIQHLHALAVTLPRPESVTTSMERNISLTGPVYKIVDHQPYRSLMSVRIPAADGKHYGVLNIDCCAQNAFNDSDMEIADAAACALGLGVDRYRSAR